VSFTHKHTQYIYTHCVCITEHHAWLQTLHWKAFHPLCSWVWLWAWHALLLRYHTGSFNCQQTADTTFCLMWDKWLHSAPNK